MSALTDRTMIMSGGSRGIGLAIAKKAAAEGANVAIIAKTDQPHPKLEGTVHTAAAEIEEAGSGGALAIVGDVRDEQSVAGAVEQTVERFGGIDIVVNNASAINLAPMRDLPVKRLDLMLDINLRGTFVLTQAALPHLRESDHAHVLSLSPPLSADPKWLRGHSAYTVAKYGMTMVTLGVAADEADAPIAANTLWPRTLIATAAVQNLLGGDEAMAQGAHARDLRRLGARGPEARPARVHRQLVHRRRGAGGGGRDRPVQVPGRPVGRAGAGPVHRRLARVAPMRILFVCMGNICRSPTAEGVFRALAAEEGVEVEIDSAGTGSWHVGAPARRARHRRGGRARDRAGGLGATGRAGRLRRAST